MSKTQLIDIKADIRERLLHTAIRLFAEKGIEGVSMRTINAEAGTKNKSAVHYHFGSKSGIVSAIFDRLNDTVAPAFEDIFTKIEKRAETEDLSVAETMLAMYIPFIMVYNQDNIGPSLIKLISKMMLDVTPDNKRLFNEYLEPHVKRVFNLLRMQLPHKPEQHLRFQIMHSLMATITGVATLDMMDNTPLGDIRFNNDFEMMTVYFNYVVGGLTSEGSIEDQIDMEFWHSYLNDIYF